MNSLILKITLLKKSSNHRWIDKDSNQNYGLKIINSGPLHNREYSGMRLFISMMN